MKIRFLNLGAILIILLVTLGSCGQSSKKNRERGNIVINPDSLIKMNKNLVRSDMQKIEEYLESREMEMHKSGTGMFYQIVRDKGARKAGTGDIVVFSYKIKNLRGDLIYSSEEDGRREFEVDRSYVESGWNEAAKLMGQGDSAIVILPPHLAFRNVGDGNKIGAGTILVYELRMDALK